VTVTLIFSKQPSLSHINLSNEAGKKSEDESIAFTRKTTHRKKALNNGSAGNLALAVVSGLSARFISQCYRCPSIVKA